MIEPDRKRTDSLSELARTIAGPKVAFDEEN
jgi:hypothetical protein